MSLLGGGNENANHAIAVGLAVPNLLSGDPLAALPQPTPPQTSLVPVTMKDLHKRRDRSTTIDAEMQEPASKRSCVRLNDGEVSQDSLPQLRFTTAAAAMGTAGTPEPATVTTTTTTPVQPLPSPSPSLSASLRSSIANNGKPPPKTRSQSNSAAATTPTVIIDCCVFCAANKIRIVSLNMRAIVQYTREWVYYQLADNKWNSIWLELVSISDHVCDVAQNNGYKIRRMTDDDWQYHYLQETQEPFIQQISLLRNYNRIQSKIMDSILYRPDGENDDPKAPLAVDDRRLGNSLDITKITTKLDARIEQCIKALRMAGERTVKIATESRVLNYVLKSVQQEQSKK